MAFSDTIRNSMSAIDTKNAMADGLESVENDVTSANLKADNAVSTANNANDRVNNIVENGGSSESTEVIDSLHDNVNNITYGHLGERLDAHSSSLAEKANKSDVETTNNRISEIVANGGTGSLQEIVDGRTDSDGNIFNALKDRLDSDANKNKAISATLNNKDTLYNYSKQYLENFLVTEDSSITKTGIAKIPQYVGIVNKFSDYIQINNSNNNQTDICLSLMLSQADTEKAKANGLTIDFKLISDIAQNINFDIWKVLSDNSRQQILSGQNGAISITNNLSSKKVYYNADAFINATTIQIVLRGSMGQNQFKIPSLIIMQGDYRGFDLDYINQNFDNKLFELNNMQGLLLKNDDTIYNYLRQYLDNFLEGEGSNPPNTGIVKLLNIYDGIITKHKNYIQIDNSNNNQTDICLSLMLSQADTEKAKANGLSIFIETESEINENITFLIQKVYADNSVQTIDNGSPSSIVINGITEIERWYNKFAFVDAVSIRITLLGTIGQNKFKINSLQLMQKNYTGFGDTYLKGLSWDNIETIITYNIFNNKVWNAVGDSFTYGDYYRSTVSSKIGAICINCGISGSTVAINGANTNLANKSFVERILGINGNSPYPDADIWTVLGGVNDWLYNTPLGDINSTDNITFYGALKSILEYLTTRPNYPVVGIMTPTQNNWNPQQNTLGLTIKNYRDAILETAPLYGVKCFDLFAESGFNPISTDNITVDGIHPNETFGKPLLSNRITGYMKELYHGI